MLRKRLIFTLIYCNGYFMQSRNFRLQKVGNLEWLENNYNIKEVSKSLDELIILNASRNEEGYDNFIKIIKSVSQRVFIPVSAGGKISKMDQVESLFKNGADKIVFNSTIFKNLDLVKKVILKYGSQSVISSIDFKKTDKSIDVYINNGLLKTELNLEDYIRSLQTLKIGEIYLNSIDRDGTGFGYDLETIKKYNSLIKLPLIISGGAGNGSHFIEGLKFENISAVATSNLFNFIGDGLSDARRLLINNKINISNWF